MDKRTHRRPRQAKKAQKLPENGLRSNCELNANSVRGLLRAEMSNFADEIGETTHARQMKQVSLRSLNRIFRKQKT
jgi:hypothetical protein